MHFPQFFESAPRIRLRDPLAEFLGAVDGGILEYAYADVVKLAGHSCPTVASAYLMTRNALAALYAEAIPERGGIRVELRDERTHGVAGVIANVASYLTGATQDTGFKGIAGKFDRRDLLHFAAAIPDALRFTRVDRGAAVDVAARLDRVPGDPRIGSLVPLCIRGVASAEDTALFRSLWQDRVRRILLEHAEDPDVFVVRAS